MRWNDYPPSQKTIGLPVDEGANMFVLRRDITPKTEADNLVEA